MGIRIFEVFKGVPGNLVVEDGKNVRVYSVFFRSPEATRAIQKARRWGEKDPNNRTVLEGSIMVPDDFGGKYPVTLLTRIDKKGKL